MTEETMPHSLCGLSSWAKFAAKGRATTVSDVSTSPYDFGGLLCKHGTPLYFWVEPTRRDWAVWASWTAGTRLGWDPEQTEWDIDLEDPATEEW